MTEKGKSDDVTSEVRTPDTTTTLTAKFVRVLHYLFMAFMVLTPFVGNELMLSYHFITVPFLLLHWIMNNDTCALTLMESKLLGLPEAQTFTGSVIKPIYNMHMESKHYYWIAIALFAVTTYRLWTTYHFEYLYLVWLVTKLGTMKIVNNLLAF